MTALHVGPGTRVLLAHPSPLVKLDSPFGTIVREDEYGYWIVALDLPAICEGDEVTEIRESLDNMKVVVWTAPSPAWAAAVAQVRADHRLHGAILRSVRSSMALSGLVLSLDESEALLEQALSGPELVWPGRTE